MRLFLLLMLCAGIASAKSEDDYVREWCEPRGGIVEYRLPDKARVDCLLDDYAVEFDFSHKWAESVGQALYYSSQTGRKPGVALIIGNEWQFAERLFEAIQKSGTAIRVWFVRK